MKITKNEISIKFDELIHQKKTREEIVEWAVNLQQAEDKGNLEYIPKIDEKIIWEAIIYLTGVDLKERSDKYLHPIEDFIEYRKEQDI